MRDPNMPLDLHHALCASYKAHNTARRKAKGRAKAALRKLGFIGVSPKQLEALQSPNVLRLIRGTRGGKSWVQDRFMQSMLMSKSAEGPTLVVYDECCSNLDLAEINRVFHSHADYPEPPAIKHAFVSRRERREPTQPKGYQPPAWVTRKQRR